MVSGSWQHSESHPVTEGFTGLEHPRMESDDPLRGSEISLVASTWSC